MTAYYNEFDPKAAAWLRELIAQGLIAPGDVDERSISDVQPDDLRGYTQHHFFAGIGVWSYALRCAGWPDDRPVCTGSCPCQPFSAAGKRKGTADERHLWPHWHWLISELGPSDVFGEQVASKDGRAWLDTVSADMEALGFAVGAADLCAAGVGAPHIRQRLFFHGTQGLEHATRDGRIEWRAEPGERSIASGRSDVGLADADDAGSQGRSLGGHGADQRAARSAGMAGGLADADSARRLAGQRDDQATRHGHPPAAERYAGRLADAHGRDASTEGLQRSGQHGQQPQDCSAGHGDHRPSPTNGFWRDADWLGCRDGKWRPVRPGTFPLAHGSPARVGRLRGYGNAIVAPLAQEFIQVCLEARDEHIRLGIFA